MDFNVMHVENETSNKNANPKTRTKTGYFVLRFCLIIGLTANNNIIQTEYTRPSSSKVQLLNKQRFGRMIIFSLNSVCRKTKGRESIKRRGYMQKLPADDHQMKRAE